MFFLVSFLLIVFIVSSTPIGYLIAKSKGINIQQHGSGNIGATNVGRVIGKRYSIITFLADALKGYLATTLSVIFFNYFRESLAPIVSITEFSFLSILASVLGHCYSIFLKFRGGKGVATAFGGYVINLPIYTLISLIIFIVTTKVLKKPVALGSILAVSNIAILSILSFKKELISELSVFTILLTVGVIIYRHKDNIKKLFSSPQG